MFIVLLTSLYINPQLEKPIFEKVYTPVEVEFVIITEKDTLRQILIKGSTDLTMLEIRPWREVISMGKTVTIDDTRSDTVPLFIYSERMKTIPREYILGYIFFGKQWAFLSAKLKKIDRSTYSGVGGLRIILNNLMYPVEVKKESMEIKIDGYRNVKGLGLIPEKVYVYNGKDLAYTRTIERVSYGLGLSRKSMEDFEKKIKIDEF
ncbi:hypothetical protein DRQ23_03165 [bacterium]|nr:MAG: hypothetical protein DRQ23_03165 [bacterium]